MLIKCNILLLQNSPDSSGGRQKSQTITIMRLPAACVMDANSRPPPNCHCHSSPSILCIFSHAMNRQTGCKTMESVSVCCYSFLTSVSISKQLLDENSLIFTVLQGSNPSDTGNRWGSPPPPLAGSEWLFDQNKIQNQFEMYSGEVRRNPFVLSFGSAAVSYPAKNPRKSKVGPDESSRESSEICLWACVSGCSW